MTLPNAYKGVKKLFIAEILQIAAIVLLLIGLVAYGVAAMDYEAFGKLTRGMTGVAIGSLISICGALLLPFIAFILTLVGLNQASKDEHDYMRKAFLCTIWALILAVIASCLQGLQVLVGLAGFLRIVCRILEICMIVFSIMGVSEVTQNISRQDVADMGPKIITIAVIAIVAATIASLLGSVVGGIAATIAYILMLVAYITYFVFLARATSALAKG